jgi:GT2 family glycosyltransferase
MSSSFPDDLDVAVVSHNGRHTLPDVMAGLADAGVPSSRITLYDIASTDDTKVWLQSHWPEVRIVALDRNEGPNPARNRAIADATRRFLLLVDSDARLAPAAVRALHATAAREDHLGAVVPVVVHAERPDRIQYAGASLHFLCEAVNPWSERPLVERGSDTTTIGTAPGVAYLLSVEAARAVHGFDDRYFMGKEDGEFCFRLKAAGYRIVETPDALAFHASRPRSTWLFRYQVRNRWHFILKNFEGRTLLVLAPALAVHEVVQFGFLLVKGELVAWLRGLGGLVGLLPSLHRDRADVGSLRVVRDRDILTGGPLMIRSDMVGRGAGSLLKRLYDAWLSAYWDVAKRLLPSTSPR